MDPERSADVGEAREKILDTAARLFSEQGYENTSISQVARAANVSKALIFWYFETKDKLYRSALQKALEPYFIRINDLDGLDERAQIERLVDEFAEFVLENVYSVRFLLSVIVHTESQTDEVVTRVSELYGVFRSLLVDIIASGQRSGVFRPDCKPTLDAALIMATLDGVLIENFVSDEFVHEPQQLINHLKTSLLDRLLNSTE